MGLKIRLARGGSKKRPYYRIVVADARAPRDGRFIEKVGTYNPMLAKDHADRVTLVTDRIQYWLGEGAQPTDRVTRFLAAVNMVDARVIPTQTKKHLQSERTKMKIEEREAKRQAAAESLAEAKAQAEAEAKAQAEALAQAQAEALAQAEAAAKAEAEAQAEAQETTEAPAETDTPTEVSETTETTKTTETPEPQETTA